MAKGYGTFPEDRNRQIKAVLREAREALEDGNFALFSRIFYANPDLDGELRCIEFFLT